MQHIDGDKLIGTSLPAHEQGILLQSAWKSHDYFAGRAYPRWAFGTAQWPKRLGPVPVCLTYAKQLIEDGVQFTLRNGSPQFSVPDDDRATAFLRGVIDANKLEQRYSELVTALAHHGSVGVLFSVDKSDKRRPIRIDFLTVPDQVRFWFDPHQSDRVLMARVQYPYRDVETGDWYYYRCEYTERRIVTYKPRFAASASETDITTTVAYQDSLGDTCDDDGEDWQTDTNETNSLGVIPISLLRNRVVKGNPLGISDLWLGSFAIIDLLCKTLHLEDRCNQLSAFPLSVLTNGVIKNTRPPMPGEFIQVQSSEGQSAQFQQVEASGTARSQTHTDLEIWTDLLYQNVGLSRVDTDAISAKGAMTEAVFSMVFARSIATSDMKRELIGNSGLSVFFGNLLTGLKTMGGWKDVAHVSDDVQVSCAWPSYFAQSPGDLTETTDRTIKQLDGDLLTHEQAIQRVASAEKIPDSDHKTMREELMKQREAKQKAQEATDGKLANGQRQNHSGQ